MALRFLPSLGIRVNPSSHLKIGGLWGSLSQTLWNPSSLLQRNGSSIPASGGEDGITLDDKALCGGTSVYTGAQNDEWIITLAKFAIDKNNENQNEQVQFVRVVGASHTAASSLLYHITLEATVAKKQKVYHAVIWLQLWRNLMEVLVWKPVHDALSAVGVKRGDLKLHEAVMLYVNQKKKDQYRI